VKLLYSKLNTKVITTEILVYSIENAGLSKIFNMNKQEVATMNLYICSSFLLSCSLAFVSSETLQEAIVKDMMPERSPLCSPSPSSTSSDSHLRKRNPSGSMAIQSLLNNTTPHGQTWSNTYLTQKWCTLIKVSIVLGLCDWGREAIFIVWSDQWAKL
jgi:hypothetical protein